jgi:hypothetical protein
VAVEVFGVGGLFGNAYREVGDDRGDQIQNRVQRFGEDAQAAGDGGQDNLQKYEQDGRAHRAESHHALFAIRVFGWLGHRPEDYTLWPRLIMMGRGNRQRLGGRSEGRTPIFVAIRMGRHR